MRCFHLSILVCRIFVLQLLLFLTYLISFRWNPIFVTGVCWIITDPTYLYDTTLLIHFIFLRTLIIKYTHRNTPPSSPHPYFLVAVCLRLTTENTYSCSVNGTVVLATLHFSIQWLNDSVSYVDSTIFFYTLNTLFGGFSIGG